VIAAQSQQSFVHAPSLDSESDHTCGDSAFSILADPASDVVLESPAAQAGSKHAREFDATFHDLKILRHLKHSDTIAIENGRARS
jgi:hypothetical protein